VTEADKFCSRLGDNADELTNEDFLRHARAASVREEVFRSHTQDGQEAVFHFEDDSRLTVSTFSSPRLRHVSVQIPNKQG